MTDQNNDLIFRTNGEEKFRFSGDGPWKSQTPAKRLEITAKLSPASQSVLDAFRSSHTGPGCLVAALRAAVDEVAPDKTIEDIDYVHQSYVDGYKDALYEILNLADELDAL
jgi:hypothetical protein